MSLKGITGDDDDDDDDDVVWWVVANDQLLLYPHADFKATQTTWH